MRAGAGFFLFSVAAIAAAWWWLGRPVEMPLGMFATGQKLDCVSYAPFRGEQTPVDPNVHIAAWQIEDDLKQLSAITNCVRTYSVHLGLEEIVPIAARLGMKVMLGIWISRDRDFDRTQIATGVAIAKKYPDTVRSIMVGNEVLLRGELSAADLAAMIRDVKSQVAVPVTYADVWEFWLRYREVGQAVDFVTIHILPYWENDPLPASETARHMVAKHAEAAAGFPGKDIMIGEIGWPSAGRMREGALPSLSNEARVIQDVVARARAEKFQVNVIEAYDQPWKRRFEGTVGGHWGLFEDATRAAKFPWGAPVSDHPGWVWQAAVGIAMAILLFGCALALARWSDGAQMSSLRWAGVALNSVTAGVLLGWTLENAVLESLGIGGWVRSLALAAVAFLGPLAATSAVARESRVPSFARTVGRRSERSADLVAWAAGLGLVLLTLLAIQTALGLVFDPRYRDLPFAPLTAAVVPYGVAVLTQRAGGRWQLSEILAAAVLAACAVFIAINEGVQNWQALWLCAALLGLALILSQSRDVQS